MRPVAHPELGEHVAHVRLHRLLAEAERRRFLRFFLDDRPVGASAPSPDDPMQRMPTVDRLEASADPGPVLEVDDVRGYAPRAR